MRTPQYHRLHRIQELIHEGTRTGSLPNCGHFIGELEVSRRTVIRDRRCSLRANSGIGCGNECNSVTPPDGAHENQTTCAHLK